MRGTSVSPSKYTIPHGKIKEDPTISSALSHGNADKSVANNSFEKSSARDGDAVSITKAESPISQMAPSSPTANSAELPIIFAGVKAKTFTGAVNKKAKSQLPGSEKHQKDISARIPTSRTAPTITQSEAPSDNGSLSETRRDELLNQPHQSETQLHFHSINTSKEEKISSVLIDQVSQDVPDRNKSETTSSIRTDDQNASSVDLASPEVHELSKQAEQSVSKSPAAVDSNANEGRNDSELRRSSPGSQVTEHDTKNTSAATNREVSFSTSRKDLGLDIQTKEQDMTSASVSAENKALASISSKGSDSQLKEQDTKSISAATANSEGSVSTLSAASDNQAKELDTEIASATASSEPTDSSSNESDKLNLEVRETTETTSVEEGNAPSSPVASGDKRPSSRVEALKHSSSDVREGSQGRSQSPFRPQSPFGRMTSLNARREAIAQERNKEIRKTPTFEKKPWFIEKAQTPKPSFPKRSIKQQLEFERKIRKLVSDKKCRTYRKAEIVVQLLEMNFAEVEALQAAHECSTLEQAISYLQQECLLCTGMYPVGQIVSMIHCPHKACRECIKAYFTIQIRDRTIMELLCPFCNEPDIGDEDVAQDYFNHLDILLKKLVESDIHELFQRKLRDRVLMKDPNFRWCSQCSSGFIAMPNLKRLICPDCNAITCASCRRPWERDHEGISCEAFAAWKDASDPEAQSAGLAKLLQEDGIDCPSCHFRYTLAKGGCMHFRCIQCQHDFCSGCSKPFKMGQKCGVSEYCVKLGLHAHHPRNCLFYLRDKDPEDLQRLLELNDVEYDKDPPEGMELKSACQVMEQKETPDGLVDDICGKEVVEGQAGLCRVHYVEYLGQLVNKHKIDPIQIFCNDDLELVLRRASKRLPAKSYRDTEIKYREKLVQLIQEELPLELTEGS